MNSNHEENNTIRTTHHIWFELVASLLATNGYQLNVVSLSYCGVLFVIVVHFGFDLVYICMSAAYQTWLQGMYHGV